MHGTHSLGVGLDYNLDFGMDRKLMKSVQGYAKIKMARREIKMTVKNIQNDVVEGVLKIFQGNIEQIILYGSVARGEQNTESDIDIALILYSKMKDEEKRLLIDWSTEFDFNHNCVLSIVDIAKEQFEKWNDVLPFYRNICKEGIILWKVA